MFCPRIDEQIRGFGIMCDALLYRAGGSESMHVYIISALIVMAFIDCYSVHSLIKRYGSCMLQITLSQTHHNDDY